MESNKRFGISTIIISIIFICSIFFVLLTSGGGVYALNLADFNQPTGQNSLGGPTGVWKKNNGQIKSTYVFGASEPENVKDGVGCSLRLEYDVSGNKQEAGFWSSLRNRDLGGYKNLVFWIKGRCGDEKVYVGIKDDCWFEHKLDINRYLPDGITTYWQQVIIPLDDFSDIYNWASLNNFSITFNNSYGPPYKGIVYIDDFRMEGTRPHPPLPHKLTYKAPPADSLTEDELLDVIQKAAFYYFWKEADPDTGLIKDRCKAFYEDDFPAASIASLGFGLTAICLAESKGWINYKQAYERVLNILRYLKDDCQTAHGFYYHMIDMKENKRWGRTEISSIDTALLIAGVIFTGEYFKGTEIEKLADEIYERVDWKWMLNGGKTFSHGFRPESGFIPYRWSDYNEAAILYILAIGSPTHPIPPECWRAWGRTPYNCYKEYKFFGATALFTHQYSHIWIDFRNKEDDFADYFENSVIATMANRRWCLDNANSSKTYGDASWGLTACDGPDGYKAYGAPYGVNDGTVAPTAAIGSIIFTPEYSLDVIKNLYTNFKDRLWGKYGFVDSYNWDRDWVASDYIGIDQGPIVLMIENLRNGFVWNYFMQNENIQRAMNLCRFKSKPEPQKAPRLLSRTRSISN